MHEQTLTETTSPGNPKKSLRRIELQMVPHNGCLADCVKPLIARRALIQVTFVQFQFSPNL